VTLRAGGGGRVGNTISFNADDFCSGRTNPQGLVTADFDADGKLDLAVANNADNTVSILLGNGAGAFTTKSTPQWKRCELD